MSVIGDKRDLQNVLDVVRESAAQLVSEWGTQRIVENVKQALLDRGLFVAFDGPPIDTCNRNYAEGAHCGRLRGHAPPCRQYGDDVQPRFKELAEKNRAEGGCGCAPGTLLCPH